MLKRLNFLKSSLETHSPRQTTNNMRLKSLQKRDSRIVDTWKKEMETPSVSDILSQYLKDRPTQHPTVTMMDTIDEVPREGTALEDPVLAIMADPKDGNSSLLMLADADLN